MLWGTEADCAETIPPWQVTCCDSAQLEYKALQSASINLSEAHRSPAQDTYWTLTKNKFY